VRAVYGAPTREAAEERLLELVHLGVNEYMV
jgi:hypothetical protein